MSNLKLEKNVTIGSSVKAQSVNDWDAVVLESVPECDSKDDNYLEWRLRMETDSNKDSTIDSKK